MEALNAKNSIPSIIPWQAGFLNLIAACLLASS